MEVLTVDAKGHVTIPKSIREQMDIKPGDKQVVYNRENLLVCKKVKGETSILQVLAQPTREKLN
ncbi:MAG TPA: AbrB/MazE/SpoVT family DNA-binding domain-containing protein [Candidatus Lokiarchaeia archaeon]|nr:AbrB/MazE/SpoVT family DNA-binding domain-containing protein [Candidatus Lokiarchaeia archaeon]